MHPRSSQRPPDRRRDHTGLGLNLKAFGEMSQAAADVVLQLSMIEGPIRDGRPVKAQKLKQKGQKLTL